MAPKVRGSICSYYPAAPDSNPKHKINTLQLIFKLCCKNDEKEVGVVHSFKKEFKFFSNKGRGGQVVSVALLSTPTIRVRIPLIFSEKIVYENEQNKQKEVRDGPFVKSS